MDTSSVTPESHGKALSVIVAGLTGLMAGTGSIPTKSLAILMPVPVAAQKTRRAAFAVAFAYYAAAVCPLLPGADFFYRGNITGLESIALWLVTSALLAAPYGLFWIGNILFRPLGIATAMLPISILPHGLIACAFPVPLTIPCFIPLECCCIL